MTVILCMLFATLAVLMYLILSKDEYAISPAGTVIEKARLNIEAYLTSGNKKLIYDVLGKKPSEVIKIGFITGGGLGFLTVFICAKFIGLFALLPGLLLFATGFVLADLVFQNEYRRWQSGIFEGVPNLVNFMPSFLEVGGIITPREALSLTIPFISQPLQSEMKRVVDKIERTGRVKEAFDEFAERTKHPVIDAICFRLSASWDAKITPDIFEDLNDQIKDLAELEAANATAKKGGLLALLCVVGLIGAAFVFGFPAVKYLFSSLGGVFLK